MENNNTFIKFVANYTDEEILKSLEDPSDIDPNVYNALLITAKERGLITEEEFSGDIQSGDIPLDSNNLASLEAEKNKYWKCPGCHQLVEMEYVICWNCQKEQPINIEHPNTAEIIEETKKISNFNPVKTGYTVLAAGIIIFLIEYGLGQNYGHLHLPRIIIAGLFVLGGFILLIIGIIDKLKKND